MGNIDFEQTLRRLLSKKKIMVRRDSMCHHGVIDSPSVCTYVRVVWDGNVELLWHVLSNFLQKGSVLFTERNDFEVVHNMRLFTIAAQARHRSRRYRVTHKCMLTLSHIL